MQEVLLKLWNIKWAERYTSNARKEKRKGKIFIDWIHWIRNSKGASIVAPCSIRARKGAKVSMPIRWDELDKVAPDDIDMKEALLRIESENPWEDFFENDQILR